IIFGASGLTGLELCRQALAVGHRVIAGVRHPDTFPLHADALRVVHADVLDGSSLAPLIDDVDAALSTLGASFSRRDTQVYSAGTKAIVAAIRASDHTCRLVVVSAGLTPPHPPKGHGFVQDRVVSPLLRNVIGRTVYEDMLRMEDYLATCDDIAWTIMRPARLINGRGISMYRLKADFPVGNVTSRADLAAAMLGELGPHGPLRQKVAPTTR